MNTYLLFLFLLLPDCGSWCDFLVFLEYWSFVVIHEVQLHLKNQMH